MNAPEAISADLRTTRMPRRPRRLVHATRSKKESAIEVMRADSNTINYYIKKLMRDKMRKREREREREKRNIKSNNKTTLHISI